MAASTIAVYETTSCNGSRGGALLDFLRRRYPQADVRHVDLAAGGDVAVPPALLLRLDAVGDRCLPALVADGTVLSEGGLPNFIDAVTVIDSGEPLPAASCCGPGTCCG